MLKASSIAQRGSAIWVQRHAAYFFLRSTKATPATSRATTSTTRTGETPPKEEELLFSIGTVVSVVANSMVFSPFLLAG